MSFYPISNASQLPVFSRQRNHIVSIYTVHIIDVAISITNRRGNLVLLSCAEMCLWILKNIHELDKLMRYKGL